MQGQTTGGWGGAGRSEADDGGGVGWMTGEGKADDREGVGVEQGGVRRTRVEQTIGGGWGGQGGWGGVGRGESEGVGWTTGNVGMNDGGLGWSMEG